MGLNRNNSGQGYVAEIPAGVSVNRWKVILPKGHLYRILGAGNCKGKIKVKSAADISGKWNAISDACSGGFKYNGLAIMITMGLTRELLSFVVTEI